MNALAVPTLDPVLVVVTLAACLLALVSVAAVLLGVSRLIHVLIPLREGSSRRRRRAPTTAQGPKT